MSLWADYAHERLSAETIEEDYGFITYRMLDNECYIEELYIIPPFRKSHLGTDLANRVRDEAKEHGVNLLTASTLLGTNCTESSVQAILGYGFKIIGASSDRIFFAKEI